MSPLSSASPGARATVFALLAVLLVAVLSVATALTALAGLGELSDDLDITRAPAWFWYHRSNVAVRRWLAVGAGSSSLTLLVLISGALLSHRRPLHGAARWATAGQERRAGLRAQTGVLLGRARGGGFLIADGPEHVMLYAPTRTGKGVGIVIPNLLTWPGSVVVLDIKRENFAATAGYRVEGGQTVHLFDPLAADGKGSRFNPLGHVDRADAVVVLDELQRMAAMLFPGHDKADPFWSEAARTGFIGVGGYVAATPALPFTLGEIFRQLTHADARAALPRRLEARAREGAPVPAPAAAALLDFCGASENTFSSVRQSITSRMGLWLNPRVDAATGASDFDLRDLRKGRLSLYLGTTPDNLLRVQPLYALLIQQLVDLNSRTLPGPADQATLVVLDEFARLGRAPVLAHAFSWVAGYGLRLLAVLQSPAQLRAVYGPDLTEDILTNCGVEIVFAPKELRVAQDLSERLGMTTVEARSRSRPRGLGSGRHSVTTSDQRRALMLPQELTQLPDSALIVLKAGLPAVRGRKIRYWREAVFRRRLRAAPDLPATPSSSPLSDQGAAPAALDFDTIARAFASEGLAPPAVGADEDTVGAWLDRVVDVAVRERDL